MRLEEAELSDSLGGDTACREVGDAAVFEFEADVGDVDFRGEDGQADGSDFPDWRGCEAEDDVEVVNHEIEDDVDVERTRGEDAKAVALKEHGLEEMPTSGSDGGVEALEMSGLDDAIVLAAEFEDAVGIGEALGYWLLDEEVDTCGEEWGSRVGVMGGGDADRGRVELCGCERRFDGREDGDVEFLCGFGCYGWVNVDQSGELDGLAGLFEFAIDAEVIAAEGSGSDDGYAEWMEGGHLFLFDGFATTSVELEEMGDLIFGFCTAGNAEAGSACAFAADIGLGCDEFEQIERDVLGAARCIDGFHEVIPLVSSLVMLMVLVAWEQISCLEVVFPTM